MEAPPQEAELIATHRVRFASGPLRRVERGGAIVRVGFVLDLLASASPGGRAGLPGSPACLDVHRRLEAIARSAVASLDLARPTDIRVEIQPWDGVLIENHDGTEDVRVRADIDHDFSVTDPPTDAGERGVLDALERALVARGVREA